MQILSCNPKRNQNCKGKEEIGRLFEDLHFSLYTLYQRIEFVKGEDEYEEEDRIVTHNHQKLQFTLDFNQYQDNNNFVRINKVEITKNRW